MAELSVLIPARNERWLSRTVEDVVSHVKADTEVIIILDGAWPEPGYELIQHNNVHAVYLPEAIGQRAATNLAAKISTSKFIMKLDGHCAVADGFDKELIESAKTLGPETTQIPAQYNLHVFDWLCDACGRRDYQGPTLEGCRACNSPVRMDIVWNPIRRRTEFWRFDSELKFQYWGEYKNRSESKEEICDVMTSLGACFFMERERFWQLGGLDEKHGSWGQFGVEIACKSWLSGGRHVVNKRTWFSHMFRTQGGDFGFPYPISGTEQDAARIYSRNLWKNNAWSGQVKPLRWLIEKFAPVPGWTLDSINELPDRMDNKSAHTILSAYTTSSPAVRTSRSLVTKGIVWYTDNQCPSHIMTASRDTLFRAQIPMVSVSLKEFEVDFGTSIVLPLERSILTMFKQILAGLEHLDGIDVVFLAEHDCLYPAEHFAFTPERDDVFYYDQHVWKVDATSGRALHYLCSQTSGLCANRRLLVEHYRKRVELVETRGFSRSMGFEPGTHNRPERVDDYKAQTWFSEVPIVDIRHGANLTPSRWRREQFKNQKYTEGWTEAANVPGWPRLEGRTFEQFLQEVAGASQQAIA